MRCRSCTTELWGRPAVCPVCGTPTGLVKRSSRQTPPPWGARPGLPPKAQPKPQPASQPLFNAADLLDPEALEEVLPLSPEPAPADIFTTGPLLGDPPAPQQGMLNAADLFDPDVLADLTGQTEDKSFQNNGAAAPALNDAPLFVEPEIAPPDDGSSYRQPPRAATGPIAPPFFRLATLPGTGPQPASPPPPFPPRERRPASAPLPPLEESEEEGEEEESAWAPQRGYRIVSGPPPLGAPTGRPMMSAQPEMYPVGPYPMPAPPGSKGRPPIRRRRSFFSTLGGLVSLLVVLAIIGSALLFGASRYFQLQALLPKPAQTTQAILPTIAPKAGYTIYTDQALGYSLQYINNWQKQADHDKSDPQYRGDLFQPAGPIPTDGPNLGFEVGSSPQYGGMSPSQIDDYIMAQLFPFPHVANIQTSVPASPTIHILNQDWTAEDADVTLSNGVNLRITCLAILHNGRGYAIFYFARQEIFSNDYIEFFQPMLLSFRFLNG
jgi:hypothetical protein